MDRVLLLCIACHQAWYAYRVGTGERAQSWSAAPEWQRAHLEHSVRFWEELPDEAVQRQDLCAATHLAWGNKLRREGWTQGTLDPSARTHPLLVPYVELTTRDRAEYEVLVDTYLLLRQALSEELN